MTTIRCDDCDRKFIDANALLQHRKFRHPSEPLPKSRALIAEAIEQTINQETAP